MKRSLFATAAAIPLGMSIAVAKRIDQKVTGSAIGPAELSDFELDLVAAGSATVTGTNRGNSSTSSDSNGVHNKIQHNFPPT